MASSSSRRRRKPPTTFRRAVESVPPPVSSAYNPGLQALDRGHRSLVIGADTSRLTGSIDLDAALKADQPNAPRWDYGIGYRDGNRERAIWIEVHGAQTNKVKEVVKKLRWLKDWLNDAGQPLAHLTLSDRHLPAFVWLASASIKLPSTTPQAKLASQEGIFPRRILNLP